jgi:hypothetical protein
MKRLFHVSEDESIKVFVPRPPPSASGGVSGDAVWSIDEDHLAHYLLPQDCPRVALRSVASTSPEDRAKFFPDKHERILAVEFAWYARIQNAKLYVYELPTEGFEMVDSIAGYWIARHSVVPLGQTLVTNAVEEIVRRGYKLRLLPDLLPLRDAALLSSVQYSIIRMRNATAPPAK